MALTGRASFGISRPYDATIGREFRDQHLVLASDMCGRIIVTLFPGSCYLGSLARKDSCAPLRISSCLFERRDSRG
jgi:hypothetical protein